MHNTLLDAIANKRVLHFTYDELPRVVEPHAYGLTSKGKPVLRGFQTDGETTGWKLFSLDKITDLVIVNNNFREPRAGYRRGDKQMSTIHAEL